MPFLSVSLGGGVSAVAPVPGWSWVPPCSEPLVPGIQQLSWSTAPAPHHTLSLSFSLQSSAFKAQTPPWKTVPAARITASFFPHKEFSPASSLARSFHSSPRAHRNKRNVNWLLSSSACDECLALRLRYGSSQFLCFFPKPCAPSLLGPALLLATLLPPALPPPYHASVPHSGGTCTRPLLSAEGDPGGWRDQK